MKYSQLMEAAVNRQPATAEKLFSEIAGALVLEALNELSPIIALNMFNESDELEGVEDEDFDYFEGDDESEEIFENYDDEDLPSDEEDDEEDLDDISDEELEDLLKDMDDMENDVTRYDNDDEEAMDQ